MVSSSCYSKEACGFSGPAGPSRKSPDWSHRRFVENSYSQELFDYQSDGLDCWHEIFAKLEAEPFERWNS